MALTNEQLILLDNLIYALQGVSAEGAAEGEIAERLEELSTVGEIVEALEGYAEQLEKDNVCWMSKNEWDQIFSQIKNDKVLSSYEITNFVETSSGMRAACFVDDAQNPTDVNVIFRGTSSSEEWHDNGTGLYESDTVEQIAAAEYVNSLPESYGDNITVSGHSKGGNKAQYVTIVTDRIQRCVSIDGQGFSEEFLEKYSEDISQKSSRILSISARNDVVNALMFSIAGEAIYIDTEFQLDLFNYHKPNILLDSEGNLLSDTSRSVIATAITEYTTYIMLNYSLVQKKFLADGVIAILERLDSGESEESTAQIVFATIMAIQCLSDEICSIMQEYGKLEVLLGLITSYFSDEIKAPVDDTKIVVNTAKLRNYADALSQLNKRVANLEVRIVSVSGTLDTSTRQLLGEGDILEGGKASVKKCIEYLNATATDFDQVENEILDVFDNLSGAVLL